MGHQSLPGAVHVHLVLGSSIDLLDVAVDAHLVQHVGDSGEHIGDGADGDDVSSEAVSIASLSHQLLGTVGIILEVVDVVVVGHSTGNSPLVGHLSSAHQEGGVDSIYIDGVAHGTADTGIGPGAVHGAVGDQTQSANTHAILIALGNVDAVSIQILLDQRSHI